MLSFEAALSKRIASLSEEKYDEEMKQNKSIGARLKKGAKEFGYFISSKQFLKNAGFAIGGLLLVLFLLIKWLDFYTLHGESIEVPDLKEFNFEQARQRLAERDLDCKIIDSLYYPGKAPLQIIEQTPQAGARVKESRTIYLVVNSSQPPNVALHYRDLIGLNLSDVMEYLETMGFKIGEKRYIEGRGQNTVARIRVGERLVFREMNPTRGEKVPEKPVRLPKGTVIDLDVYEGSDAKPAEVPDLLCANFEQAQLIVKTHYFNIGTIHVDANVTDTIYAIVRQQRPMPGSMGNKGETVDLWLSEVMPEGCEGNPLTDDETLGEPTGQPD